MSYVRRFLVVPDANVAVARGVAKTIADSKSIGSADGMWLTGLNSIGSGVPTHWMTEGMIDAGLASLLGDATNTYSVYVQCGGTAHTLLDIQNLYASAPLGTHIRSDLNYDEGAIAGIDALGLKVIP